MTAPLGVRVAHPSDNAPIDRRSSQTAGERQFESGAFRHVIPLSSYFKLTHRAANSFACIHTVNKRVNGAAHTSVTSHAVRLSQVWLDDYDD